ncbi:MAG: penicillin-binding protein activator [Deltaproteobacteria bacterium]|nr:penicillin-binding protein activator [Deltaproteobacteria bacterium]
MLQRGKEKMVIDRKFIGVLFFLVLLGFCGCAELPERNIGKTVSSGVMRPAAPLPSAEAVSLWRTQVEQLERLGDYYGACRILEGIYLRSQEVAVGERFSWLLSNLTDAEVADLWSQNHETGLSCRVAAEYFPRLQRQPVAERSPGAARLLLELARKLSSECEVSENLRADARDYLLLHQSVGRAALTIGCLLPLSGSNAESGQRLLRGMELALDVYSENTGPKIINQNTLNEPASSEETLSSLPGLRLLLYDTAGEGERARSGVRYLVNEKKVDLLLGAYTGKAANYAAAEAQSLGVTMISLSPLLRNPERYPNVFQHSLTIRNQAVALTDLAMTRLGLKDFALLIPKNQYGREFAETFAAQAAAWGGQVVRQVYYDSSRPDFGLAIRELIGADRYQQFKEKRQAYEVWVKEAQRQADKGEVASAVEVKLAELAREIGIAGEEFDLLGKAEIMPRPLLECDFEAIVVPDRAQTLKLLIPQLAFYDLEECFLLGGRYWNSDELLASTAEYAEGAFFVDAFCLDCDEAAGEFRDFRKRFLTLYPDSQPGLREIYGFDSIMLLRKLLAQMESEPDAEIWRRALAGCVRLPLASGLTTTRADGEIAKQLCPLTFKKGHITVVGESCR